MTLKQLKKIIEKEFPLDDNLDIVIYEDEENYKDFSISKERVDYLWDDFIVIRPGMRAI